MVKDKNLVNIHLKKGSEQAYFSEQDEKIIKALREKAAREAAKKYCEEHKNHCFRCGTKSLIEVDRGDVKIDICVNENCGAIHLDPGELDHIMDDNSAISSIRKSVFGIFKK
jgi:hypothetical protein